MRIIISQFARTESEYEHLRQVEYFIEIYVQGDFLCIPFSSSVEDEIS